MSETKPKHTTKAKDIDARRSDTALEALDQRLGAVQVLREKLDKLIIHLGGPGEVSYPEESLCRRAISLERWLERQEHALARDGKVNVQDWLLGIKELRGLFAAVGMKRRAKMLNGARDIAAAINSVEDAPL